MRRTNFSTAVYVLLVFLSGGVVGGFAHRLYMLNSVVAVSPGPKPEDWRRDYLNKMQTRLSLSPEQVNQLGVILDSTRNAFQQVKDKWWAREGREKARPEMRAVQEKQVQKVNEILTEKQRSEYEIYRNELRKERERHRQDQQ